MQNIAIPQVLADKKYVLLHFFNEAQEAEKNVSFDALRGGNNSAHKCFLITKHVKKAHFVSVFFL